MTAARAGDASRVTGVHPDRRRAGTLRIEVDRAPFGAVPVETARALGLVVGTQLDDELRLQLASASDAEAALRTALRSLELRGYARADLARRMVRKGHPRPAVDAAIDSVDRMGLLDDAAFARNYVETRSARGRGPARLTRDLLKMGVDRGIIDRTIGQHAAQQPDRAAMPMALAAKRAAQLGELPRPIKRRRVLAFLARRGFSGSEALDAVRQAVG